MSQNKLELNADKTEFLVMGTPQVQVKMYISSITVNGVIVPVLNEPYGNLGAVLYTYAPHLWNALPPHNIKATDSVQNYKTKFKTLLFRKKFT